MRVLAEIVLIVVQRLFSGILIAPVVQKPVTAWASSCWEKLVPIISSLRAANVSAASSSRARTGKCISAMYACPNSWNVEMNVTMT
jgi:hypothetical protein